MHIGINGLNENERFSKFPYEAVNPLNNTKYIKKDGKYFTAGDELDPTREITYKQATGQDLPNPNKT